MKRPTAQVADGYVDVQCHVRRCRLFKILESNVCLSDGSHTDAIITSAESWSESWKVELPERGPHLLNCDDLMYRFSQYCFLDSPDEIPSSKWIEVYCVPLQLTELQIDRYEQVVWESYEGLILLPVANKGPAPVCQNMEDGQDSTKITPTPIDESRCIDTPSSPLRTFRRIGVFAYHISGNDQEGRRDELFILPKKDNFGCLSREKETVRII